MSSAHRLRISAFVLVTFCAVLCCAKGGDFDFGLAQDFVVNVDAGGAPGAGMWGSKETTATVGKVFHLVVPREAFDESVKEFEAKRFGGKPLPSWLLFDKKSATFWGVPLQDDLGPFQVIVKSLPKESASTYKLTIDVIENNIQEESTKRCAQSQDITILTLLLDKNARIIKPKQRVVAIDNIARFFGLPFSAFSLKPQTSPDDITDSSVVLAGPGTVKTRASKYTSFLQVPVGCDGRLWDSTTPMVHQLKQQARDGTISEVLRLPLIGWRVKTETRPVVRSKRQALEDGSGDYEDYYDEYEDEDYDGEDGETTSSSSSTSTTSTTTTTTTTTTTEAPTTHPHRHHHGQSIKPIDPSVSVIHYPHHDQSRQFTEERVPITVPTTSTTTTTTTTTTPEPELTTSNNREIPKPSGGPANYDYEYYDENDDEDGDDDGPEESQTVVPTFTTNKQKPLLENIDNEEEEEGNENQRRIVTEGELITEPLTTSTTTTVRTTVKEVTIPDNVPVTRILTTTVPEEQTTQAVVEEFVPPVETTQQSTTTTEEATTTQTTTTSTTTTTTPIPITIPLTTTTEQITTDEETETPRTTSTTTTTTTTELPTTTQQQPTTRQATEEPKSTTTVREVTETIEFEEKNFKPYIENRLQQMSVFAGKIFRFVVPINTFKDFEDEYNLSLEFLDSNEQPVGKNSWCQFNRARREIYGLPLEKDVSKWTYYVRATDTEGSYVQDTLTIQVQQHKMARVINHEYILKIRVEKPQEFPHYIDWSLKTLRALGKIYNSNMSEITVKKIVSNEEPVVFSWYNDTIPSNYCPKDEISSVFKTLVANTRGDPSRELSMALAPELRVLHVSFNFIGVCEQQPVNPATPRDNFSPILRNPVDQVNATIGELLIYKVKDDTFYDPEDVDPRTLNISLLTATRQHISPHSWLQFDSKNREFFGIPRKAGRTEYQLVCEDSGGLSVTDSLEVVVSHASKHIYNVEFSMTLEMRFDQFATSASKQKKFVEKLMEIFHDRNSSNFHFAPFRQNGDSTVVTWFNQSLDTEKCPNSEINRLEGLMINKHDDHVISHRFLNIMGEEFIVSSIKINMIGNCNIKLPSPPEVIPIDESTSQSATDEYLITFIIPIVIISGMLFIASVAACVLYRRRRMGKMNVEEDGRANYGNKGIPVIFQEELEEKPEPGTKAPVILKDEKPPLAPPEYSKSGSVKLTDDSEPYQPPPPFTRSQDNGKQSRPKPTPTYRKPPPYVPP